MQRVTITLDDDLIADLDRTIAERGVRHGHVVYVPAPEGVAHSHGHPRGLGHAHSHRISHKRARRRSV